MFTDAAYDVVVPDDADNASIQRPVPSDVNTVQVGVSSDLSDNINYLNISIDNKGSGDKYVSVPIENIDAGEINTIDISDLDLSTTGPTPTLTPELVEDGTNTVNSGTGASVTDVEDSVTAPTTDTAAIQDTIYAGETNILVSVGDDSGSTFQQLNITNEANGEEIILEAGGTDFSKNTEFYVNIASLDISEGDTLNARLEDGTGAQTGTEDDTTVSAALAASVEDLNPGEFAVGSDGAFLADPVLDDQNQYTILLNPSSGAFADEKAFGESDDATLDIVSPAGATTQVELTAPDLFSEQGEAVRL
ncbi:hypothetical protein PM023_12645 [Halorubrum ezzemoulense]|nr:hypothetical protein [Halorubrum ezzemoulense]MDB2225519.1 hypothetical protein [Halorubrum ezzemoulense]